MITHCYRYLLRQLSRKLMILQLFVTKKSFQKKDQQIWLKRTGEAFEMAADGNTNIYSIRDAQVPFYFVQDHNHPSTKKLVQALSVDVLLNAGTPRKLSKEILEPVPFGVVNLHPGLLPEYRSCSAVEWALFNDDKLGNTAHFMTEGYDEGPIIFREWYEFPEVANYTDIRVKIHREAVVLAIKVLIQVLISKVKPEDSLPQDEKYAKCWKPIPDDNFNEVVAKVNSRHYKYQRR